MQTNLQRDKASRAKARFPSYLPPTTGEELLAALFAAGGRLLARQEGHGVLVVIRKRLVFLPLTGWVSDAALADALRAAGLTLERFLELRGARG